MNSINYFFALKQSFKNYSSSSLLKDLKAGLVVALVALPLGLALSVAVDAPPKHGLFTIITAGFIIALFGGSRFQVSGPTAAFVVILYPIVHQFGLDGLFYAGFLAGIFMMVLSFFGFGKIIKMTPFPVVTGFTSGIAFVIFFLQLKDFLGLQLTNIPNQFIFKVAQIFSHIPQSNPYELGIGIFTLVVILFTKKYFKNTPAPVIGVISATLLVYILSHRISGFSVATLGTKYPSGLPNGLPEFNPFWNKFSNFHDFWNITVELIPSALTIAALGAIESLLSAVVADSMTHTQHDPDTELFAQGLGNTIAPFWGGIAATGAIARTATNIRFGAISPIASVFHAFCILITLLFFSDLLSFMPLAALAGLLIHVAWNMADIEHIKTIIKVGQFEDKVVFLTCFLTTVLFDMTIGVSIGVFLAMILFINRIIKQSSGRWIPNNELKNHSQNIDLPENSQLYVLEGQLFFGAAQKAISSLLIVDNNIKYIILDFTNVDDIDLTALTALYSSLQSLKSNHKICLMIHLKPNINKRIENFLDHHKLQDHVHILQNLQEVLKVIEKPF